MTVHRNVRRTWWMPLAMPVMGMMVLTACASNSTGGEAEEPASPMAADTASDASPADDGEEIGGGELTTLRVGTFPTLSVGVMAVADELGYMADEGLELEYEFIQSSQDANVLLAQGGLDVVTGSISAGFLNSIEQGLDVQVVSGMSHIGDTGAGTGPPSGVYVRKELVDSGEVTSFEDMEGRKVSAPGGIGGAVSYLVGLYAEAGGLTLDDVEVESLGVADAVAAMESGAVDIAFLSAPFSTQAVESGLAVPFGDIREVLGEARVLACLFGPTLLNENREAGEGFLRAIARAADRMEGDYREDPEIVTALSEGLDIDEEDVQATPPFAVTTDWGPQTLASMQEMFLNLDDPALDYDEPLSYSEVVDEEMLAVATGNA